METPNTQSSPFFSNKFSKTNDSGTNPLKNKLGIKVEMEESSLEEISAFINSVDSGLGVCNNL